MEFSSTGDTACIDVMIIDDDNFEGDKNFTMIRHLLILQSSIFSMNGNVVITIVDNAGEEKQLLQYPFYCEFGL